MQSPLAKSLTGNNTFSIAAHMEDLCVKYTIHCTNINIQNDTATVSLDPGEQVLFSLHRDVSKQFASLQLTIGHLTIEGKRFSRLDFRFDNPVITY